VIWVVLFAVAAVAFFTLGWPADTLARAQSARGGLLWGGLTFGLPAAVWFIAGLVAQSRDKTSEVAFGLVFIVGAISSCVAIVLGTLTARAVRRHRALRGHC
jgi:ABC-type spermidine/putrescine transport system permease subunit II